MANEPHAGEFICADCGKHRAWMSHKVAKFIEETQRRFGALEVITIGAPQERAELRNRDHELPEGARIEVVNSAYAPRRYLATPPCIKGLRCEAINGKQRWLPGVYSFGAWPVKNKKDRLSAAETQAKIVAPGKAYHEIADAVAFLSERYGKHNVQVILKQRQEVPTIKRLDDEGNEIETETQSQRNIGDDTVRASDMFPSKYLKSSDVKDKPVTATISHLTQELVGQGKDAERKPILHFEGSVKPLILNKTNAVTIEQAFGDSDDWPGHRVRIGCVETSYAGKAIDGIRVKPLAAATAAKPAVDPGLNDEVTL